MAEADPGIARKAANPTLAQTLVEQIEQRIVRGDYRPGERLVEAELAADFGVGRGSIREALRRLEANRYIRFEPNRGAMVSRPTAKQVTDMLRIRGAIAGLGARAAAERIALPGHRDTMRSLLAGIEQELSDMHPAHHRKGNGRFHRTLNELSGIEDIGALMDQVNIPMLYEIYFRDLTEDQWRTNLDDHFDLARAVLAGDGDAAEAIAKRHMHRMIERATLIAERWAT
ncbi:GntR family transcriptional regulator [Novosphingobium colocasiae]|uniref:GntR family transcriptional regulator n=1 Tax=Novosphingobium colocasiae TaxID=1256513 RepID=A0A918PFE5_9SPHN|nr:GntR family transcriptional regulator [Novosphingobium colocasiae]GGZ05514.1 GntR family transcriptional regulator [Novosphingobium colocasiae]